MKTKAVIADMCSNIINVSNNSIPDSYKDTSLVRRFNKGKSFTFTEWEMFNTYTNDEFQQDFVSYKNALLACAKTHTAESELKLIYDEETGTPVGVDSEYWIFVFASGINYNDYYINLDAGHLGSGLAITPDNVIYANSNAITIEDIKVAADLNDEYHQGTIIKAGTPIQKLLNAVFSSSKIGRGQGVQIYTPEMLNAMDPADIPDTYISIPSANELQQEKEGSSYVDILFSAIRSLQAEVAKMRNAFKFGMYSYNGTDTAISKMVEDNNTINDEEPLWSIEESDLSEISEYFIDFEGSSFPFYPKAAIDTTNKGVVKFLEEAYWSDNLQIIRKNEDPKIFLYTTSDNLNIKYELTNLHNSAENLTISLNNIVSVNPVEKYNVLFLVSKTTQSNDSTDHKYYGHNYIWISVSNFETNEVLAEGYYDASSNKLVNDVIYLSKRYTLSKVFFNRLSLYKFSPYSKYQDLSNEVIPSTPSESDYKYKVAHITIRSVKDYNELESIALRLPNNELIWEEKNNKLWIKTKDSLITIGGDNPDKPDSGMTQDEVIKLLEKMGIVHSTEEGLQLSNIGDVTFINEDTKKSFKFKVDSEGNLKGQELPKESLKQLLLKLENSGYGVNVGKQFRGFVAKVMAGKHNLKSSQDSDLKLNSDRVKIGAVYCPLTTDKKFGCTHGFIELESTLEEDFPLEGCYLHYLHPSLDADYKIESLPLTGVLKANSTYLIRCKQYADPDTNADVFINVDNYDQEWYIKGELLDLVNDGTSAYAFALTYGNKDATDIEKATDIDKSKNLIKPSTEFVFKNSGEGFVKGKNDYIWKWYFIDSLLLNKPHSDNNLMWGLSVKPVISNSIIKNTFELDPAKQAFQSLTKYDSSRYRLQKTSDLETLNLDKEYISFPHSDEECPVSKFAPKSSKCHKTVATDKSKLDLEKPNIVNCAFGIDVYTTRCFNWISSGTYDEYVFIKEGPSSPWKSFESYKTISSQLPETPEFPRRKEFNTVVNNTVYQRMIGSFPGDNTHYTAHKCIVQLVSSPVVGKKTYTYIVGRKNKNGQPDLAHCSEERTFTLYSTEYKPRIYQITDQQGFTWLQYQVWAAAAKKLNEKINSEIDRDHIIPVLINTGDMTQNGTRVNEWLDYYNAGRDLFDHLEQMNVVGNNDLCNTDVNILGTGDDIGKSNGFYFHVFYCYEVNPDERVRPIIKSDDGIYKYIPSLYYFDFKTHRMLMVNSEITIINCRDWFNKKLEGQPINIYTGWTAPEDVSMPKKYSGSFTSIYTMLYRILKGAQDGGKNVVAACHEMPFTVITNDSLTQDSKNNYRSYGAQSTTLIGSHLNQICSTDRVGIYWFSRLLEYFGIKLCIGGHKHTYAATFPVREFYEYMQMGQKKNSKDNGPMTMEETLANDESTIWLSNNELPDEKINYTKYPLIDRAVYEAKCGKHSEPSKIHPFTLVDNLQKGVVYFMCQATGFKLTSNKELPSNYQEFAQLIPQTAPDGKSPDVNQQKPMFAVVDINGNAYNISLIRLEGILQGTKFSQQEYSSSAVQLQYAKVNSNLDPAGKPGRYCEWITDSVNNIISIK